MRLRELPSISVLAGTIESCDDLVGADAIAVGVGAPIEGDDELQPRAGTVHASARYRIDLAELAHRAQFTAAAGTTHTIDLPITHRGSGAVLPWAGLPQRIIIVGVGTGSDADLRKAGAGLARASRSLAKVVTTVTAISGDRGTAHFVEGYLLGAYPDWSMATGADAPPPATQLVLLGPNNQSAVDLAARHAQLTYLGRDLAAVPANFKNPAWLADQFEQMAADFGLGVTRFEGADLIAAGFGGTEAVGRGSATPPVFLAVSYEPEEVSPDAQHVAIVGKGVTFDTGGISIKKPREYMIEMKNDMTGAAVAFGALLGAAQARVGYRVTALLPLVENHFGAQSYRPGDILTMFGGMSVEVGNTDAEGRLIMADALAYASKELHADLIIDVATLTGAAEMALGHSHAALFATSDELAGQFLAAGSETGERLWRLPIVDEYRAALDSSVADLRNIADLPVGGGAIVAALFLKEFVGDTPWVHLDIAGPAFSEAAHDEINKGHTGFGARVITRFLEEL